MKLEYLIFLYAYMCLCVIVFDVYFLFRIRSGKNRAKRIRSSLTALLQGQLESLARSGSLEPGLRLSLRRQLEKPERLLVFNDMLQSWRQLHGSDLERLISQWSIDLPYLFSVYEKKPSQYKTLFAYWVSNLHLGQNPWLTEAGQRAHLSLLAQELESFLMGSTVYVREKTFRAILSLGRVRFAVSALTFLSDKKIPYSGKLITDNLLTFTGDRQELADCLLERLADFSPEIQWAVVNYLRFLPRQSVDQTTYLPPLISLLQDESCHKELRLAIVRYLGKYPAPDCLEYLLNLLHKDRGQDWEFGAVAASTLAAYPGPQTETALEKALGSVNWYVRYNAAESLLSLGFDLERFLAVSSDRYAREMLNYRNTIRILKQKKQSLGLDA